MDIAFVRTQQNLEGIPDVTLYCESLGLGILAEVTRKRGFESAIIEADFFDVLATDLPQDEKEAAIAREIVKVGAPVIGLAATTYTTLKSVLRLARLIKRLSPKTLIVLGGHTATFMWQDLLAFDFVDVVVRGEGEETIAELMSRVSDPGRWHEIAGIAYRDGTGRIELTSSRPLVADLDAVPWPRRTVLAQTQQAPDYTWIEYPHAVLSKSRGCYAKCNYCSVHAFYGSSWRTRSPRDVVDEMQMLNETYDVGFMNFIDDIFIGPGNKGRKDVNEFASEILRRGLDVRLHATLRTREVGPDTIPRLYEAGMRSALIGVESAVQERLDWFKKFTTVEMNLAASHYLFDQGIYTQTIGFLMFLPDTSIGELRVNMEFIRQLPTFHSARFDLPLQIVPGFHITDIYREVGLVTGDHALHLDWTFTDPAVETFYHLQHELLSEISEMEGLLRTLQYALAGDDEALRDIALTDKEVSMAVSTWLLEILSAVESDGRLSAPAFERYQGRLKDLNGRYLSHLDGLRAKAIDKGTAKRQKMAAKRGCLSGGESNLSFLMDSKTEETLPREGSSPPLRPRGNPRSGPAARLAEFPA